MIRSTPTLTRDEINALVRDFVATEVQDYHALHMAAKSAPALEKAVKAEDERRARMRRLAVLDIANDRPLWTQARLEDFLESRGKLFDRDGATYAETMRALAFGMLTAFDRIDQGAFQPAAEPAPPPLADVIHPAPPPPEPPKPAHRVRTIAELIEPHIRERQRSGIGSSWITEIRTALAWFAGWFGDDHPIDAITADGMRDLKEGLLELPKNWSKKLKGMTIREAAEHNRTADLPRLDVPALIGKRWKPMVDFLAWAHANGYAPTNPADGMKIMLSRAARSEKKRDQFEIEDLSTIFNAPIFRGAHSDGQWWEPGTHQIRDHRFWLPLLAAFTGGRRGELCQLRTADVITREGVTCLYIRERFDEDGNKTSSVKTADSVRLVPLHPELVKIGFPDYVAERRRLDKERLFDCPETNNYDQFGKWFSRFLTKLNVKTGRNCFHSFRHCMEQAMRENIDDFTARFKITGRTNDHSSERYGKGHTVATLAEQIAKVRYPGLDLTHLALAR